jgi:hypothetical protein
MKKTVEEKTITNNKKVSVTTKSYTTNIEAKNEIKNDTYDSISETQYSKFESLLGTGTANISGGREAYLSVYKEMVKLYLKTGKDNSIYFKTAEQLGTTFSGASLLQNSDFFKLIDVQGTKDSLNKKLSDNPCMVIDTEPNEQAHPLQVEIIKEAFLLSARAHIVDYSLRNLPLTSTFDNLTFYQNDSSYADFIAQSFIQRIEVYNKYFSSLVFYLKRDLETALENGQSFFDPITKNEITFETPSPIDYQQTVEVVKSYMKFLVDQEIINIAETFNRFFDRSLTQNGATIQLSPKFNAIDCLVDSFQLYIKSNVDIVDSNVNRAINRLNIGTFFFLIETPAGQRAQGYLCLKRLSTKYNKIINLGNIIAVNGSLIESCKQSLKSNSDYDLLFNYCFNPTKALNFASTYNILLCSRLYEQTNISFEPCILSSIRTHNSNLSEEQPCEEIDVNFELGLNAEIAKIIAQTPITIVKALAENFDPNIAIAKKIKDGAEALGSPDLSIIPYSAYLMVPPPFGPMIPVIPPWGYIYWGISAAEAAYNRGNSEKGGGVGFGNLGVDINGSFDIKNPFKPNC